MKWNKFPIYLLMGTLLMSMMLFGRSQAVASTGSAVPTDDISGMVFLDTNDNGIKDGTEVGIFRIEVRAYSATGGATAAAQAASGPDGTYTLTGLNASEEYRIEIEAPKDLYQPSVAGSTTTFFVQAPNVQNIGLRRGGGCVSPRMATSCFVAGTAANGGTDPAIVSFDYAGTNKVEDVQTVATGSIYGLAYDQDAQIMYGAAFLKRHVGLGSGGLGGIYSIDYSSGTPVTSLLYTVPNVGTVDRTGANALGAPTAASLDADAFGKIGKVGLGDLDIDTINQILYVTNLSNSELVAIDISNKASITSTSMSIGSASACNSGVFRPFAVRVRGSAVVVGGVCTAELTDGGVASTAMTTNPVNLSVQIHSFTPGLGWASVFSFSLNPAGPEGYQHGDIVYHVTPSLRQCREWEPWVDLYTERNIVVNTAAGEPGFNEDGNFELVGNGAGSAPFRCRAQPMVSDIEFTEDESMIIGLMDRTGHQLGYENTSPTGVTGISANNGGDIVIAALNGFFGYDLESNGVAAGVAGTKTTGCANAANCEGPGGREFFFENGGSGHDDADSGGLALWPGQLEVASIVLDPPQTAFGGGVSWYSTEDGSRVRSLEVYAAPLNTPGLGKANGLGDLELMCAPGPIEIGNLVWLDTSMNGIQDPGEPRLAGIEVVLTCDGTSIVTTTDGDGQYLFSSTGNAAGLLINGASCTVSVARTSATNNATLGSTITTRKNEGGITTNDRFTDIRDSDAGEVNEVSSIPFTVDGNNHSLDFGFNPDNTAVALKGFSTQTGSIATIGALVVLLSLSVVLVRRRSN